MELKINKMELKFKVNQKVWLIYNNEPTVVPVHEIRIDSNGIKYYFWHEAFKYRDAKICTSNLFSIDEKKLFVTKEELIKSL